MLILATLLFAGMGCSSEASSSSPSIYGNWVFTNEANTRGFGLTFNTDGTYAASVLQVTSAVTLNVELEAGAFIINGSDLVLTPQRWTCPGPDPVETIGHSFVSGNLLLSLSSGAMTLRPNNGPADASIALVYGCFDRKTNEFKRGDLAAVSNE